MVLVSWLLVLDEEEVLVYWVENLRMFQAHFEDLLRLNPWACASWPLAYHPGSSLPPRFSSPSVSVDVLFSVATLNGHSCCHPHLERTEAGSAEFQQGVQLAVAAGWHARMNVEVLAHAI